MTPGRYNIVVYEGASFRQRFVWRAKGGRPVNLTGYDAILRVRSTVDSIDTLLELSVANGGIELFGASGVIELAMSREAVLALPFASAVYDLLLFGSDGATVAPLLKGKFIVEQGVTR